MCQIGQHDVELLATATYPEHPAAFYEDDGAGNSPLGNVGTTLTTDNRMLGFTAHCVCEVWARVPPPHECYSHAR